MEREVGITLKELADLYVLESIKGFGPQKFKALHLAGIRPTHVLEKPDRVGTKGKRWDELRSRLRSVSSEVREQCHERASRQIGVAQKHKAALLTWCERHLLHYPAAQ